MGDAYTVINDEAVPSDCVSGSVGKMMYETEHHL